MSCQVVIKKVSAEICGLSCENRSGDVTIDVQNPHLGWRIVSAEKNIMQTAYQITVEQLDACGNGEPKLVWNSGRQATANSAHIRYEGEKLRSFCQYRWTVEVWINDREESLLSDEAVFSVGFLEQELWQGGWISYPFDYGRNPRFFRREFSVKNGLHRAVLYSTSRGIHEEYLNGSKISDAYFAPGWTDYKKRIYYRAYDVTEQLYVGDNVIGAILAEGWYKGPVGYAGDMALYGNRISLLMNLRLEYADGSVETISTDEKYVSSLGPFQESTFLTGETYDSRYELSGWSDTGYDSSAWKPVLFEKLLWTAGTTTETADHPLLQAACHEPVRAYAVVASVADWETAKGSFVFDLGQNFAGVCRLTVKGNAGTVIRIRYAEVLNPDKSIYVENLRSATSTDELVLRGGQQQWSPRFTFHGFRYIEITGISREEIVSVEGVALSSALEQAGSFECSSNLVNKLYSNIVWTQRSNFIDVPTDCPQRDERLGWTGDAQVFIKTATYNLNALNFFRKWLIDLEDTQDSNGAVSNIAPHVDIVGRADAGWGDAATICPWWLYQIYGDRDILVRSFPMMTRWVDYLTKTSENGIRSKTFCFGDWLSINSKTPNEVIQSAFYIYSTQIVCDTAKILGEHETEARYRNVLAIARDAFIQRFVEPDGKILGDSQTAYVLALQFDLLPETLRTLAINHLRRTIEAAGFHLTTGFLGTPYLMPTISENGMHDLAARLLLNTTYPSWGYSIVNGATTIWERWNGWTESEGCGDANMNSYSHYAYGAVGEWLFSCLGGIRPLQPGYKKIRIAPQPADGISWVNTEYQSVKGTIRSCWKKSGNQFKLQIEVPANTQAEIILPAGDLDAIDLHLFQDINYTESQIIITVGSGCYTFVVSVKEACVPAFHE